MSVGMKLNDLSESRKMLKLLKENRHEPRPPRSYSEFSKSPKEKKHSFEKPNITQQQIPQMVPESMHMYTWGLGSSGQLAQSYRQTNKHGEIISSQVNNVWTCSAGEQHTFFINSRNEVYASGNNGFGQLGIDQMQQATKPIIVPALKDLRIAQIACGSEHTFILTQKGEVYSWGLNIKGQLGLGMYENVSYPTLVYSLLPFGYHNGKAAGGHKRMKSANDPGQMDVSPGLKERCGSIDNVVDAVIMLKDKFARQRPAAKKHDAEQLTQILLKQDEVVQSIACGALHTIVLTSSNRLLSCGYGELWTLGHDEPTTLVEFKALAPIPRQKSKNSPRVGNIEKIACGLAHSGCVIDGKPYVWGIMGQRDSLKFTQPTLMSFHNDDAISQHIHNEVVIDIRMGEFFTVFLTSRGEVYSIGENVDGQLGIEGIQYTDIPLRLQGLPLIAQIAAGRNHCLALGAELQLFGWGQNSYGQITGNSKGTAPITTPRLIFNLPPDGQKKIFCGGFHSILLAPQNFDLSVIADDSEYLHEDVSHRKSTQNLAQMQIYQEKAEESQMEIERLKKENEALQKFNIQLVHKVEKMNQINTKNKSISESQGFRKSTDQKTQTTDSYLVDQKKGSSQNIKKQSSKFDITALEVSPERPIKHRIFQTSLDIDYNELVLDKQISEGGYGIIYKAKWRETVVAVKMFKIEGMNETHIRDFLSECHAMEALRHPNIVMFLGACTKPPHLAIVLEYCQKGSLWSVLQNHDIVLTWEDRRRIALDAAKGVWYLHCFNPPILHRDLKSLNLLLDDALRTKLADFGWTRALGNYMTGKIGTYQWMAPEVIGGHSYTEKADVFSYGIILWEIAAREPPYRNISGLQVSIEVLNNDYRPSIPKKTPDAFAKLTRRCWDRDPDKRPSFKEIIKDLETMKLQP